MNDISRTAAEDDLKRKLVRRVAFAGALIAMLLAALAFVDYLGRPAEEELSSGPTFTAPVPVARKEVSQPVTPVVPEPAAAVEPAGLSATPGEATAAPPTGIETAPVAAEPERPLVSAQPVLPRQPAAPTVRAPHQKAATPVAEEESSAAATMQPASPPPAAEAPRQAPAQAPEPPAPPRLVSGYAVQAGVFADAQHAEELRAKLMLNGIPSTLEARVQVGPFKTRAEAESARKKLKALGIDGLLLPPRGRR